MKWTVFQVYIYRICEVETDLRFEFGVLQTQAIDVHDEFLSFFDHRLLATPHLR